MHRRFSASVMNLLAAARPAGNDAMIQRLADVRNAVLMSGND